MEEQEANKEVATPIQEADAIHQRELSHRLSTIGWALVLIWIGVAFLAKIMIGITLVGIGVITLGIQIARISSNLKPEGFWLVVGVLFLLGGLWELFEPDLPLVSILLIVAGVILLISVSRSKKKQ